MTGRVPQHVLFDFIRYFEVHNFRQLGLHIFRQVIAAKIASPKNNPPPPQCAKMIFASGNLLAGMM
jgi:hypothetical protein